MKYQNAVILFFLVVQVKSQEFKNWTEWTQCSASCGVGRQQRKRECADGRCVQQETRGCRIKSCVNGEPTTSDSKFTDWEEWTRCSRTCGSGLQERKRECANGTCVQSQRKTCLLDTCGDEDSTKLPEWSACSATCGQGVATRIRQCPEGDCKQKQTKTCYEEDCSKTNGTAEYENWQAWSSCSVTCGPGTKSRIRLCKNVDCRETEVGSCGFKSCPGKHDAECLNKGGTCKDFEHNICTLGYEQNLCSGDNSNRCCFTCDATNDTCNEQVAGWKEGDGPCRNELQGNCRYNSNYCEGTYYSGYCGGPGKRQCCSTQGPATDEPPTTEPFDTESPPQTQGTPGTGPTKPSTTIKETVGPEKTTTRGDVGEPESSGLSGGAIAGIVISVFIIVFGLGVAFYYHRQGGMPSMSAYVPSFRKKSVSDSNVPTSLDNPIMFIKETADVKGIGDDDAGGSSNA